MRRLPPLNSLRAFEAAARSESFIRAAAELHVTPSAVSHQIRTLEEFLGVELFRRGAREVRLTQAGQSFLPPVHGALEQIATAAGHLMRGADSATLVVSAAPAFAIGWLVPRLSDFYAAHPDVEVRLDTSLELLDFRDSDVDVCIRYTARSHFEGLRSHLLFCEELVPVCSPGLVQGEKGLREPADLVNTTLLHSMSRAGQWRSWLSAAGVDTAGTDQGQRFPNDTLALEAAAGGLGVALANRTLVEREVIQGRLVVPFETGYCSDYGYYLVYPRSSERDEGIATFRDWLLAAIGDRADIAAMQCMT